MADAIALGLKEAVESELNWEPSINAAEIAVATTNDGIVTLSGRVMSYWERIAAERAAERVEGVIAVVNELEVRLPNESRRTDEDIAQAGVDALHWSVLIPDENIKVIVSNGWVTLEGMVNWQFQKKAAEKAIRKLVGVRGITNSLEIKPRVSRRKVKASIEAALKRLAQLDSKQINVEVDGETVILTGTVHSWFEREEAERAAWSEPGIRRVEDLIIVAA